MPSLYNRSLRFAYRRTGVYILVILSLLVVAGCEVTTGPTVSSTAVATVATPPTPTATLAATATLAPEDAIRDEVAAMTNLRGEVSASRPSFEVEQLANVAIVHVVLQLASPTLSDVQWDAFLVQQSLWSGQEFAIPDGWEVSVEFFVPSTDAAIQSLGREIGVANLHTASARRFAWSSLSPEQAWSRYDSVAFNQNGL